MKHFNAILFSLRMNTKQQVFKLTTRKAALEIGISAPTLSRLNRGTVIPDLNTYFLCCKWMNLELDFFFNTETNEA